MWPPVSPQLSGLFWQPCNDSSTQHFPWTESCALDRDTPRCSCHFPSVFPFPLWACHGSSHIPAVVPAASSPPDKCVCAPDDWLHAEVWCWWGRESEWILWGDFVDYLQSLDTVIFSLKFVWACFWLFKTLPDTWNIASAPYLIWH